MIRTEIWVILHVVEEIVHPAHIPFHRKAKTTIV